MTPLSTEKDLIAEAKMEQPIGGIKFDRYMVVLISWFIAGLYLDGWAHAHILRMETFFTPWHAVLYSAYLACALTLVGAVTINHLRGCTWRRAVPDGYELSLLCVPLFAVGGVADMIWHILFGIEVGIEPLLSPPHLLLASSGLFIVSAPFRVAWRRSDKETRSSWANLLPMLLSLLATYSVFTFFTEYAHPFVWVWLVINANTELEKAHGMTCILLQAGILMCFVLPVVKRWQLPFGGLTLVLTLNAALMSIFVDQYRLIPTATIAGLVADVLIRLLHLSDEHLDALRLFAFLVPLVLYLGYFIELKIMVGITWTIHLWLGSSVMAGIVGLVLSYLLMPPKQGGSIYSTKEHSK